VTRACEGTLVTPLSRWTVLALAARAESVGTFGPGTGPVPVDFTNSGGTTAGGSLTVICPPPADCSINVITLHPGLAGIIPPGTMLKLDFAATTRLSATHVGQFDQPFNFFQFFLTLVNPVAGHDLLFYGVGTALHSSLVGEGSSATFVASTALGDDVQLFSDFMDFSATTEREVRFTINSITPLLQFGPNDVLASFSGQLVEFDINSTPLPTVTVNGAVPEPSTVALFAIGTGLLTLARWRNRRRAV
jgi:hypothetical protein